jgi:hypothetical protein
MSLIFATSVPTIMDRTGIKTARTVNKRLDALAATGWLSIERPSNAGADQVRRKAAVR